MRIIAGKFRGRNLSSLGKGDAAAHLRPTGDRVREAVFSMLEGGRFDEALHESRVLDVFAGTGALGLEALSRGAANVTFVENGRVALGILGKNIELCRADADARILRRDATRPGACETQGYSLVFLDPPYGQAMGERALNALISGGWLAPGALVVWEESVPPEPPSSLRVLDQRRFGDSLITFLRFGESASAG